MPKPAVVAFLNAFAEDTGDVMISAIKNPALSVQERKEEIEPILEAAGVKAALVAANPDGSGPGLFDAVVLKLASVEDLEVTQQDVGDREVFIWLKEIWDNLLSKDGPVTC